jgi:hypothetical protein
MDKENLLYFAEDSMQALFAAMHSWQVSNQTRLLSVSVQRDGDQFCCIALSNPMEVHLVDSRGTSINAVNAGPRDSFNCLCVNDMG